MVDWQSPTDGRPCRPRHPVATSHSDFAGTGCRDAAFVGVSTTGCLLFVQHTGEIMRTVECRTPDGWIALATVDECTARKMRDFMLLDAPSDDYVRITPPLPEDVVAANDVPGHIA